MRIKIELLPCLQRVREVMQEHPRISDPQIEVGNLPATPGHLDIVVNVVGFIVIGDERLGSRREGIYACDKYDSQTHERYISIETNYLGALGKVAERIAAENELQLFKYDEGGGGDFAITLPLDSTKEQIRKALDRILNAVANARAPILVHNMIIMESMDSPTERGYL